MQTDKNTNEPKEKQLSVGKDFDAEKEMLVAHEKQSKRPTTLNEIWGVEKKSPFPANTEDEYRKYLDSLNKLDLQRASVQNDLPARDSRDSMSRALVKKFKAYQAECGMAHRQPKQLQSTPEFEQAMNRAHNDL